MINGILFLLDSLVLSPLRCPTCSSTYRFPRFNDPWMLLKTRSGRCGEAANLFACLCRSVPLEARYIYDPSDHVWVEVFLTSEQRWVHCDPCENLCDAPLVYEHGWKKQLTFCIAFGKDHIEDVTWRYVQRFSATIDRRNIDEKAFGQLIRLLNERLQSRLAQHQEKQKKIVRRYSFRSLLVSTAVRGVRCSRMEDLLSMIVEKTTANENELHGRQSGSTAWKLSRHEIDESVEKFVSSSSLVTSIDRLFRKRRTWASSFF